MIQCRNSKQHSIFLTPSPVSFVFFHRWRLKTSEQTKDFHAHAIFYLNLSIILLDIIVVVVNSVF